MARYVFTLDRMHINNQRGKHSDMDVVTFGVQRGSMNEVLTRLIDRQYPDAPGDPFPGAAEGVSSGDTIEFSLAPPANPRKKWEIGPVDVLADDAVVVHFAAVNTSDSSGGITDKQAEQIGLGVLDIIAGVVGSVVGGPFVGAAAAAISAVLGDMISNLIPDAPHCNGLVAGYMWTWTGSELARLVSQAGGTLELAAQHVENADIPSDCGHPGDLDIYGSVSLVETESVKDFLGPSGDLSNGVFALAAGANSIRDMVERWSWMQPKPS